MMSKTAKPCHPSEVIEESSSKTYPIQDIFQLFFRDYSGSHSVSNEQQKAAFCISECKTGSFGYNLSYCESCGRATIHACSCNNRNCPSCQAPQEQKWIMARNSELIEGCAYYHCIFTSTWPYPVVDLQNQVSSLSPAIKDFSFRWKQWERCSVVNLWLP